MDQSIFYVDIENLQGIAKQALTTALENWPEGFPSPTAVNLYVKADQTEMWNIWADSAVFGARFANEIWPVLEKYGVQMPNANARPRRYEMTKEAKRTAERPE